MQAFARHLRIVTLLMAVSAAIQAVLIARAVVPALDAVRFAALARQIDTQGLVATARSQSEPPLFGVWVWVVHTGLVAVAGEFPASWALSTQLAAAIPLVLTLLPLYAASVCIYGRGPAVAGCLFFACLPEIARLGPDGISDSTSILLISLAFAACVAFFAQRFGPGGMARRPHDAPGQAAAGQVHVAWLLAAGVATAVALQVRKEALVLPSVLAVVGLLFQLSPATRLPWRKALAAAGAFGLGFAAIFGPYLLCIGALTPTAMVRRVAAEPSDDEIPWCRRADETMTSWDGWRLGDGGRMTFAPKDPSLSLRQRGLLPALARFAGEIAKLYWYWVGLLLLYALGRARSSGWRPLDGFVWIFVVVDAVFTVAFSAREGYLGARHLLPLIIATIGCAGRGAIDLGERLAVGFARRGGSSSPAGWNWLVRPSSGAVGVVLLAALGCLAKNVKPLNFNAAGHRAAAAWLACEAPLSGAVIDTHGWAALLSGRKMHMFFEGRTAFTDPAVQYFVLEQEELNFGTRRSQTLRQLLARAGQQVALFGARPGDSRDRSVAVYRWRPELLTHGVAGGAPPKSAAGAQAGELAQACQRQGSAQ